MDNVNDSGNVIGNINNLTWRSTRYINHKMTLKAFISTLDEGKSVRFNLENSNVDSYYIFITNLKYDSRLQKIYFTSEENKSDTGIAWRDLPNEYKKMLLNYDVKKWRLGSYYKNAHTQSLMILISLDNDSFDCGDFSDIKDYNPLVMRRIMDYSLSDSGKPNTTIFSADMYRDKDKDTYNIENTTKKSSTDKFNTYILIFMMLIVFIDLIWSILLFCTSTVSIHL